MLLPGFVQVKFPLAVEENHDAQSDSFPPPACSNLKIEEAICRVKLRDGGSPVAVKIREISVPFSSERGDDSQALDAEMANFSRGTRVLCNFIRC